MRSAYVETRAQEDFVRGLPALLPAPVVTARPDLARAAAAERIVDAAGSPPGPPPAPALAAADAAGPGGPAATAAKELRAGYRAAFKLADRDGSGSLSGGELAGLFAKVGAEVEPGRAAAVAAAEGGGITEGRFLALMSAA